MTKPEIKKRKQKQKVKKEKPKETKETATKTEATPVNDKTEATPAKDVTEEKEPKPSEKTGASMAIVSGMTGHVDTGNESDDFEENNPPTFTNGSA